MTKISRIHAATLAAAFIATIGGSSMALAQSRPPGSTGVPPAPVGHRQPTAAEVAQRSPDDSAGTTAKQRAETRRARRITRSICSNC
ncbi:MAG: hypothetical protein K2P80_00210 [Beijerinckiaceae bacterium]|nr:hypothetical protein [Beijerinckiaceae bacterium]